jgi:hypothetical protein
VVNQIYNFNNMAEEIYTCQKCGHPSHCGDVDEVSSHKRIRKNDCSECKCKKCSCERCNLYINDK